MTTRAQRSVKSPRIEALVSEDRELLKTLMQEAVQAILDADMTQTVGAGPGERTADRTGYRSGYYSRGLVTRIGKLELRVPRDRAGRFSTELFDRYQRSEKALVSALAEMYVQGVSTRKVKVITEELCGHTFSASTISRINKSLDGLLRRFAQRRLDEAYPYLILDARYEKVRLDGVIQSQAVFIAIRDQRRGPAPNPGGRALESRVALELDGVRQGAEDPRAPRGRVRRLRRSRRPQARRAGMTPRGGVAAVLRALPPQCAGLSAPQGRRRLPPGAPLALRPAQPERGPAGPPGVAHALAAALSQAHGLGRSPHRRDLELLPSAAPTPQTSEIDQHARAAQRRDQTSHAGGPDLSQRRELLTLGPSPLCRNPRGLAQGSPLLEHGVLEGTEERTTDRRLTDHGIGLSHENLFAQLDVHNPAPAG